MRDKTFAELYAHDWQPIKSTLQKGGRIYRCTKCWMEKVGKAGQPLITCIPRHEKPPHDCSKGGY